MTGRAPWTLLVSEVVRAVSYDPVSRRLRVRFTTGRIYEYSDVPADVVVDLLNPDDGSHGRYFNAAIRDHFEYREVIR